MGAHKPWRPQRPAFDRAKHSACRRCDHEPYRQAWPAFPQLSRQNSSLVSWRRCHCACPQRYSRFQGCRPAKRNTPTAALVPQSPRRCCDSNSHGRQQDADRCPCGPRRVTVHAPRRQSRLTRWRGHTSTIRFLPVRFLIPARDREHLCESRMRKRKDVDTAKGLDQRVIG